MEIENHMRIYADNSRETAGTSGQEPSSSYRLSPYEKDGELWDVHDKSTSQAIGMMTDFQKLLHIVLRWTIKQAGKPVCGEWTPEAYVALFECEYLKSANMRHLLVVMMLLILPMVAPTNCLYLPRTTECQERPCREIDLRHGLRSTLAEDLEDWIRVVRIYIAILSATKPKESWISIHSIKTHHEMKVRSRTKADEVAQFERIKCANTNLTKKIRLFVVKSLEIPRRCHPLVMVKTKMSCQDLVVRVQQYNPLAFLHPGRVSERSLTVIFESDIVESFRGYPASSAPTSSRDIEDASHQVRQERVGRRPRHTGITKYCRSATSG
ncbi:hypothetical protein EVAR_80635_1 [Eumeta japonica]|uniref:Uncharacterized protein n=1 Tax=Eumeta variegata TaxID=151549 RepID=A0A4C1YWA2_EUMVA|nr:hypothetical protein EVAR_80635_1 [Eumeta japonica]